MARIFMRTVVWDMYSLHKGDTVWYSDDYWVPEDPGKTRMMVRPVYE